MSRSVNRNIGGFDLSNIYECKTRMKGLQRKWRKETQWPGLLSKVGLPRGRFEGRCRENAGVLTTLGMVADKSKYQSGGRCRST